MNPNKILRWVALGGIFFVPFVSLVVANNLFFPFITGKAFVFRILVMLATGAWLILAFSDFESVDCFCRGYWFGGYFWR